MVREFNGIVNAAPFEDRMRDLKRRPSEPSGDGGHLEGVLNVAKQGEAIRAFLAR